MIERSLARVLVVLGMLAMTGYVSTDRLAAEHAVTPKFDPVVFFAGRTEGRGALKVALHRSQKTLVEGNGRMLPGGGIALDQTVRRGDRAATQRRWRLRPAGPNRYTGTLTDAVGPVTAVDDGNQLHLTFAMQGGLRAEQWLYLQPGGTVAHNVMIVRKFGIPVARLDETITRIAS